MPSPEKHIRAACSAESVTSYRHLPNSQVESSANGLKNPKRVMSFATKGSNLKPLATCSRPHPDIHSLNTDVMIALIDQKSRRPHSC